MGHIYQITNSITNDCYIGKTTKTIDQRFQKHKYAHRYVNNTHLYRAMRKYGIDNFRIISLEEIENKLLDLKEQEYIKNYKPRYNMTDGGEGGSLRFITEEARANFRRVNGGENNPMFGKRGKDNPNFGSKRGKTPKISKALSNPCICDGVLFASIGEAEKHYLGKHCVRKRLDNPKYPTWYRLVPKIKRK